MRHKDYFSQRGGYVLFIRLEKDETINVGALGPIKFRKGIYVYVGRARRLLLWRVIRHMKKGKKKRWHIDYLLEKARVLFVFLYDVSETSECEKAASIKEKFGGEFIPGFGSSDCRCESHLVYLGP